MILIKKRQHMPIDQQLYDRAFHKDLNKRKSKTVFAINRNLERYSIRYDLHIGIDRNKRFHA